MRRRCPTRSSVDRAAAFSLIELLIAVTVVVIMYVLYLTAGSQQRQAKEKTACAKNLQNAYVALKTYSVENADHYPAVLAATSSEVPLGLLIPRSTTMTELFICPGSKDKIPPQARPFGRSKISYAYYMGRNATHGPTVPLLSDEQVNTEAKQAGEPVFSTNGKGPGNNHHKFGGVVLFGDGSTQTSDTNAAFPLLLTPGVTLLNPRP